MLIAANELIDVFEVVSLWRSSLPELRFKWILEAVLGEYVLEYVLESSESGYVSNWHNG